VTAKVSEQPTRAAYSLTGTLVAPQVASLMPTSSEGDREVVSGRVRAAGEQVRQGDLLAEVSGRPVIAILAAVPLYRDISPGDTGNDVAGIQQMLIALELLSGEPSGKFDARTQTALNALFKRHGYSAPEAGSGLKWLPLSHTAAIPADGVVIEEATAVGTMLDSEHPLMKVQVSAPTITARADMLQAAAFQVGAEVQVSVGGGQAVSTTVLAVGEFKDSGQNQPPGYDVTFALPEELAGATDADGPVTISEIAELPTGPAVPLTAVRHDAEGSYVLTAGDGTASDTRVGVTVRGQASGYAIIADNENLPIGTEVVLSGER
jgi:peptidoglycan hydrolase-like protein with peptidoglycan-binding domain